MSFTHVLLTPKKAYNWFLGDKLSGVLREYDDDGYLLLAVKSLYSCSEVCVHLNGVKSQQFTMGIGN